MSREMQPPPKVWLTAKPSIVLIWSSPSINSQVFSVSRCCWFRPTVKINPRCFLSLLCYSPSLPKSFSLHLTLPPSCLIPRHDLPVLFHIKASWSACLIIIDCNKLSEGTTLLHLGDCLQYNSYLSPETHIFVWISVFGTIS